MLSVVWTTFCGRLLFCLIRNFDGFPLLTTKQATTACLQIAPFRICIYCSFCRGGGGDAWEECISRNARIVSRPPLRLQWWLWWTPLQEWVSFFWFFPHFTQFLNHNQCHWNLLMIRFCRSWRGALHSEERQDRGRVPGVQRQLLLFKRRWIYLFAVFIRAGPQNKKWSDLRNTENPTGSIHVEARKKSLTQKKRVDFDEGDCIWKNGPCSKNAKWKWDKNIKRNSK